MESCKEIFRRFRTTVVANTDEDSMLDDLELLESAESEISLLIADLGECLPIVDAERPGESDAEVYRRRDLVRRIRRRI